MSEQPKCPPDSRLKYACAFCDQAFKTHEQRWQHEEICTNTADEGMKMLVPE